jgi:hypothetical protein
VIPLYQQVCNHCGADQDWPEELDTPEAKELPSAAG